MTMHCFCSGELARDPGRKTSSNGNPYTSALLKAGEELVNLTCFDATLAERLAALKKGSALAVSGRLQARPYTDRDGTTLRPGLSVVVVELMTGSAPPMKAAPRARADRAPRPAGAGASGTPFDDELPSF